MKESIIFKIIDSEAKKLLQTALLLSDNKDEAATIMNEIWDEALRQLWSSKECG